MQDYELLVVDGTDRVETSLILAADDDDAAEIASAFEPTRFWELHRNGRRVADWLGAPAQSVAEPRSWAPINPARLIRIG